MAIRTTLPLLLVPLAALLALAARAQEGRVPPLVREGRITYQDARLGGKIPAREWRVYVARERRGSMVDLGPTRDPKYNAHYPGRVQVLCTTEEEGRSDERCFVIHYLKPEDEPLARRVGDVMARLYWLGLDYLGRGPAPGKYVDVWLSRQGEAGGEEFKKNIYLFAIDQPRPPAEWVRELAHEYSHIFLPTIGEYTAPEKWASGYLGERLFMKWMLLDNRMTGVWSEPIDGDAYVKDQVTPLRDRFLNDGPNSPLLDRTDAAGMDFLIGQAMAIEVAFGPRVLRPFLARFTTLRPQNLGVYLGGAIQELQPLEYAVDPLAFIPKRSEPVPAGGAAASFRKAAYWIYLTGGSWQIACEGSVPASATASLETTPLPRGGAAAVGGASWAAPPREGSGEWRRLEIAAPPGQTLEIRSLLIRRSDVAPSN